MSEPEQSPPSEVIAEGRDTEIVAYGPGLVLRRPKRQRSLAGEAAVMDWVVSHGYPCARPVELVDDGLVMERIDGVSMLDDVAAHPWRLRSMAVMLADLHDRLHQLPAPEGLAEPFGPGSTLVHGDLHPGNVMLTDDGPLVIDWTNAVSGPGSADVAVTWLLTAAAEAPGTPGPRIEQLAIASFRRLFLRVFLNHVDRVAAAASLDAVLAHRRNDKNLSSAELAAMTEVVDRNRPPPGA